MADDAVTRHRLASAEPQRQQAIDQLVGDLLLLLDRGRLGQLRGVVVAEQVEALTGRVEHRLPGFEAAGLEQFVGVLPAGDHRDRHVQLAIEEHLNRAVGRLLTRRVAVHHEHDLLAVTTQLTDVLRRQRRPQRGDHVARPRLMAGDHVGVTFHQHRGLGVDDRFLGGVQPVKR